MISFLCHDNKKIKTVSRFLEIAFLVLSGVYLLWQESATTMFQLTYPTRLDECMFWSLLVVAVLRLAFIWPLRKEFWLSLCMAAIYYLVYSADGYRFLLYLAVLTVGYLNIDYRKILKIWFAVVGTVVSITAIAGINGIIKNLIYFKNGFRSSWGFNFPTDFASIVLFLLLILWAVSRFLPDWTMLVFSIGSILLSRYIAHSSTSLICSVLLFGAIVYHMIDQNILLRKPRLQWIDRNVNRILMILFPLLLVIFLCLMVAYYKNMGIGIRLDGIFSSRVSLAVDAVKQHGLHIFGTPFDMVGFGSSTFFQYDRYNFVDSSYPLILIRYGWVLAIAICLFWGWMIRKAVKCGNRKLALIMGIIAIHSFSEHHFIEVHYNILLVMPFAAYLSDEEKQQKTENRKEKNLAIAGTLVLSIIIAFLLVPGIFTKLKTVLQLKQLCGGGNNGWAEMGLLFGALVVVAFSVWAVYRILLGIFTRSSVRKYVYAIVTLLVCIGVTAGCLLYADRIIHRAVLEEEVEQTEQDALELITAAASGKVFSDIRPAVYQQLYDHISDSVLSGGELARFRGSTVIIDADTEYQSFINTGFLLAQISDEHAVYTSDPAVINAMTDAGYHLTGYYDQVKEIDLNYEAELNSLSYSEELGLQLHGPDQILFYGTGEDLHSGIYTVTFDLYLDGQSKEMLSDTDAICTLRASDSWGEHVLEEKAVSYGDFGEDGTLSASLLFYFLEDTFGIEFLVFPEEGMSVNVRKISYCRTPYWDIHTVYDSSYRKIREDFYTPTGDPLVLPAGFSSCEYEYDAQGNMSWVRFYDNDHNPVEITYGFASAFMEYDADHQIIRIEYYGVDGSPISVTSEETQ